MNDSALLKETRLVFFVYLWFVFGAVLYPNPGDFARLQEKDLNVEHVRRYEAIHSVRAASPNVELEPVAKYQLS